MVVPFRLISEGKPWFCFGLLTSANVEQGSCGAFGCSLPDTRWMQTSRAGDGHCWARGFGQDKPHRTTNNIWLVQAWLAWRQACSQDWTTDGSRAHASIGDLTS